MFGVLIEGKNFRMRVISYLIMLVKKEHNKKKILIFKNYILFEKEMLKWRWI
jgi:hypothetical protein